MSRRRSTGRAGILPAASISNIHLSNICLTSADRQRSGDRPETGDDAARGEQTSCLLLRTSPSPSPASTSPNAQPLVRLQRQPPFGVLLAIGYGGRKDIGILRSIACVARLQKAVSRLNVAIIGQRCPRKHHLQLMAFRQGNPRGRFVDKGILG